MCALNIGIDNEKIFTVTEITASIKDLIEERFPYVWIVGEISNCSLHSAGHFYFTLKDDGAQIRCVLFARSSRQVAVQPQNGLKVYAQGRVTVYQKSGQYEIVVNTMVSAGEGDLYVAFNKLKACLEKEGLFEAARKKRLPRFPARIGLVTSPTGAAIRDFIRISRTIYSSVEIVVRSVKVQGEGARDEIADAIRALNSYGGVDVIVLARGGGSIEDLWAFNEEIVARAISTSRIPVVSAVGHEIDFTIADFVADARAATPSAAASVVLADYVDVKTRLGALARHARTAISSRIERHRNFIRSLSTRYGLRKVRDRLFLESRNLDDMMTSGRRSLEGSVRTRRTALESLLGQLDSLNPRSILERGYSLCYRLDTGEKVKTFEQIIPGDRVRILFSRGGAVCEVESAKEEME